VRLFEPNNIPPTLVPRAADLRRLVQVWAGALRKDDSMNSKITGLRVASIVFGLMAIAQLVRLVIRPEVLVAGHPMPLWPSVLACIILGSLSVWMWKLTRTPTK
jgi:hypothetical protein